MGWSVQEDHPQATRPFAVVDDVTHMLMGSHPTKVGADTHRRLLMLADPSEAPVYQVTKSAGLDVVRFGTPQIEGVKFVEPSMKEWAQLAQSEADQDLLDAVESAGLGVIEGYASVYMIPDLVGDRMVKGCFGAETFELPYLAYHAQDRPIGSSLCTPDDYGLRTLATLAKTQAAADFLELVKAKAIPAQSFGYQVPAGGGIANAFGGEDVTKCMALEISGTPIPCNQLALITAAKHFGPSVKGFTIPTLPGFRQDRTSLRSASPPASTEPGSTKMRTPEGVKAAPSERVRTKSIEGSYEDEIEDVGEALRVAMGSQSGIYVYPRATFADRVVYQVYRYDDGDEDDMGMGAVATAPSSGTYMATYSIDPDTGAYSFGMPVPVEIQEVVSAKGLVALATKGVLDLRIQGKAGARHSRKDQQKVQAIHDHSVFLGATCEDEPADQETAEDGAKTGRRRVKAATDDGAWDAAAAEKALGDEPSAAQLKAMYAAPGESKSASKLPHHFVSDGKVGAASTKACSSAIGALNGARGGASVDDRQAAYKHLAAHLKDAGVKDVPELKAVGIDAGAIELELAAMGL